MTAVLPNSRYDVAFGANVRSLVTHHTVAASITADQRVNIVDSTAGAMALTLPPVAECAGLFFFFYLDTDGGDLTIVDAGDDQKFVTMTLADVDDRAILISDGIYWHALDSGAATAT
jgi:hypothetical protein